MPKDTKHVPTKGRERERPPLPVIAIDNIAGAIPFHVFGNREESSNGLHVAKSNAGRSAVHDEESQPDALHGVSTDLTLQDDATRLTIMTNNGDDSSKRKARSIHMHSGTCTDSEPTTKRPKNKQDRPAMSETEDNASNDEDRKPAAKDTTPKPDGVPSTCAGLKRKSTSTCSGPVVSSRGQGIKREPVIKTETASAPAPAPTPTDQVEASIPTETGIEGTNLNLTVTVRRKVAKRSEKWYQNGAGPLLIPARKKRRIEDPPLPLPTSTDEAASNTASADLPEGLPPPATPPPCTATVNVSSRLQSRRQAQIPLIETSERQPDDANAADDGDLSGRTPHLAATVNAPTSRRSSRRVIPTSSTGTTAPLPSTATVDTSLPVVREYGPTADANDARVESDDNNDDANAPKDMNNDDANAPTDMDIEENTGSSPEPVARSAAAVEAASSIPRESPQQPNLMPNSSTLRSRKCRQRQKLAKEKENQPKSSTLRSRECRQRQKLAKEKQEAQQAQKSITPAGRAQPASLVPDSNDDDLNNHETLRRLRRPKLK
jgi:hypothetical protein